MVRLYDTATAEVLQGFAVLSLPELVDDHDV